jgi:hypothetical protein
MQCTPMFFSKKTVDVKTVKSKKQLLLSMAIVPNSFFEDKLMRTNSKHTKRTKTLGLQKRGDDDKERHFAFSILRTVSVFPNLICCVLCWSLLDESPLSTFRVRTPRAGSLYHQIR